MQTVFRLFVLALLPLPITYATAHGGLVWRAALQAGETLLVHGAAGGA